MIFHTDSSTYLVERIMNVIFHTQLFESISQRLGFRLLTPIRSR